MDVTAVYMMILESIRSQDKEVDAILYHDNKANNLEKKGANRTSKIFPSKKSQHMSAAHEIRTSIKNLSNLLEETRPAYLQLRPGSSNVFLENFGNTRSPSTSMMSDEERDEWESDIQSIIQNSQKRIFEFEKIIESSSQIKSQTQLATHYKNILTSLSTYLKDVCAVYSEMKAIRVKRTIDYQMLGKLSNTTGGHMSSHYLTRTRKKSSDDETSSVTKSKPSNMHNEDTSTPIPGYFLEDEISPEEMQMLEEENAILLNELNTLSNQAAQIECSVVKIAELQEIFTEKVLQQEKEIDQISNVVVNTTENIKGGNEQIRQAIQKSADFRAWVLFFILVMSLSLLFLDWYND